MSESRQTRPVELKVTIAVGAALAVQTALGLVWAGAAAERLAQIEKSAVTNAEVIERTVRLEEQMMQVRASLLRIETKLDEGRER